MKFALIFKLVEYEKYVQTFGIEEKRQYVCNRTCTVTDGVIKICRISKFGTKTPINDFDGVCIMKNRKTQILPDKDSYYLHFWVKLFIHD